MSLSLLAAAAADPDQVAVVVGGTPHRFADLAPRVRRIAGWIERQAPARPVGLVADSRLDSLLALYALLELGRPIVALHPRSTPVERAALVAQAAPAVILDESWSEREAGGAPGRAAPAPPDDDRCLAMIFTSGTTGRPKGALLARSAFAASARASADALGWRRDDRWLLCMPLAHVGGLSIVTRCLLARRTVVLAGPAAGGRFDPERIRDVLERDRVTLASLVPTMLRRLLDLRPAWTPPPTLRAVLLGGAAASPALLGEAAQRGIPALTTYGMTETCSQVTLQRPGTQPSAAEGAGPPLAGVELRIEGGEVHVRGPMLMAGYAGHPSPFREGGWFATGDMGELDDQGRLHIAARRTDLIVSGGENVYPVEIEQALETLPGVAGACVFGLADETWGQRVAAAIVPAAAGPPADAELTAFFRANLAPHKHPRDIVFVTELPATPSGKIDRPAAARLAAPHLRPLSRPPR